MGADPGPSDVDSALWAAIFSDAITLVRSDVFYTVNWNTNSLTSWGMKEVTEDNDICKSSVFHRLLQRAFPGWFSYNSVRFFHPFYTAEQNAIFAEQQGYADDFKMKRTGTDKNTGNAVFDVAGSTPKKPTKPVYLVEIEKINDIMADTSGIFIHPALKDPANFPPEMQEMFPSKKSGRSRPRVSDPADRIQENTAAIQKYYSELMRSIVKRESITMSNTTYQIDVVRDFAIPTTTRYVADFLGFGHLLRSEENPKGLYSENEIYQHITNCHVFLSYNADETKLLKRRKAFKTSIQFLYKLTSDGNIAEAGKWGIFQRARNNPMTELGFEVAQHVLRHEQSYSRAASILVFIGLHTAYNTVLAFSSVLNSFFRELYDHAEHKSSSTPKWLEVQRLALSDDKESFEKLSQIVLQAERTSVKLPTIRTALADHDFGSWQVSKGDTIILDLVSLKIWVVATNETDSLVTVPRKSQSHERRWCQRCQLRHPHVQHHRAVRRLRSQAFGRRRRHRHDPYDCADERPSPRSRYPRSSQEGQLGQLLRRLFELHGSHAHAACLGPGRADDRYGSREVRKDHVQP
jgi:hypothetical protein